MRIRALAAMAAALAVAGAGCWRHASVINYSAPNAAVSDSLRLSIAVPREGYAVGEKIPVVVTVENTGPQGQVIGATSGALVFVKVYQHEAVGWEPRLIYPQAAIQVLSPWPLPAGSKRNFDLDLPVTPDWPTGAVLHLVAELNGRPDMNPYVQVVISPSKGAGRYEACSN